jgi:hypothetical protein
MVHSNQSGNIVDSPNDYPTKLARRDSQDAADRATASAERAAGRVFRIAPTALGLFLGRFHDLPQYV